MSLLKYAGTPLEANECNLTRMEKANILSPRGRKLMSVYRMFLEIVVKKDTVAELTTRIDAIKTLFDSNYGDAALYTDDAGTVL